MSRRAVSALAIACSVFLGACGSAADPPPLAADAKPPDKKPEIVSEKNLKRHIEFLASAPRDPGSDHLRASRTYCAEQLEALGFRIERQDVGGGAGENVIGVLRGKRKPNEQVLLSAHVDSVPNCKGADDNASGVAGAIEAARLLVEEEHARTLVVACWDLEESGLAGSTVYAQAAREAGDDIRVSFVFEMIGYTTHVPGTQKLPVPDEYESTFAAVFPDQYQKYLEGGRRGEFLTVIADTPGAYSDTGASEFVAHFERAARAAELDTIAFELTREQVALLPDTERSDHASFWRAGFPAIQLTDTAELRNPNYHCRRGLDVVTTIDFEFAAKVTQATADAVARALQ